MTLSMKCISKSAITNVGGTSVTAQFQASGGGSIAIISNLDTETANGFAIGSAYTLTVEAPQA